MADDRDFAHTPPDQANAYGPAQKLSRTVDPGLKHPPSEMSPDYREMYQAPYELGGY